MLDAYRALATPDDPSFFKTYLTLFLEGVSEHLAAIEAAIRNTDAEELAKAAHALKSTCMNVGADAIVERSAKLEGVANAGGVVGAAPLASEIASLCRQMSGEIYALPEFRRDG